jgi:aspartate aminotransferase-like enzyme
MGASLWVPAKQASNLVTTMSTPTGLEPTSVIRFAAGLGVDLTAGVGTGLSHLIRLNHTGRRATFQTVLANVVAYGEALRQAGLPADLGAASEAVVRAYSG